MATTLTLTKQEQDVALEKITAMEKKKQEEIKKGATQRYVDNVKESMLFQPSCNWNDMLCAAPLSISLLGSLFVASTVPDAQSILINPPSGGFKHLRTFDKTSLNACLIQVFDKGRESFMVAGKSMDGIRLKSGVIKDHVKDVILLLGDAETAKTQLPNTLGQLSNVAQGCQKHAKDMEAVFNDWLEMTCELHACVMQTSTDTSEKHRANEIHLAAEQTRLTGMEKVAEEAGKNLETLRDSLHMAQDSYKKAVDEFPSGWELVAQELVSGLSDSLTNAINLAVPALIENYSTTAKVKAGVNIFTGGDKGSTSDGSTAAAPVDHSNVPTATNVPDPTPSALPPFSSDPAYTVVPRVLPYVSTILSFVTGGEKNSVDWPTLTSHDSEKTKSGLGVIVILIKGEKDGFKPSADPPSQKLSSVFTDVATVTDGLTKIVGQSQALNSDKLPGPDSPEVTKWRDAMTKSYASIVSLNNEAKNATNAHSAPLLNNPAPANPPNQEKKAALRQQIINAATTKLNTTAEVMKTASTNFEKATEKAIEVSTNIANIQAAVSELSATNISLDKIKAILVKCIEILVQLKTQINRLVGFFDAIATLVSHAVETQVGPFIENLKSATSGPEPGLLGFTFTDLQRQMIFNSALSIRAYFELFKDICSMYTEIHMTYIVKGLEMANNMAVEYSREDAGKMLGQRQAELNKYNTDSVSKVKDLVANQQVKITENLKSNADNAANDLGFVPVKQPTEVNKAIKDSADQSKQAALEGIKKSGTYLSQKLSDTSAYAE